MTQKITNVLVGEDFCFVWDDEDFLLGISFIKSDPLSLINKGKGTMATVFSSLTFYTIRRGAAGKTLMHSKNRRPVYNSSLI